MKLGATFRPSPPPPGIPAWMVALLLIGVGLATAYLAYWYGYTDALLAITP